MTPPEKAKNKGRPYPLRRALLVMIIGVAFMFWMPFVIITDNYFHWLNYVIYWGATLIWLMPLVRWLKRHAYLPRLHRLRTILLLVMVWSFLIGGGWFITKRGLLPPMRENDPYCFNDYHFGNMSYECRAGGAGFKLTCISAPGYTDCFYISSRVDARSPEDFPIARTTYVHTDVYLTSMRLYDGIVGDG